ncbi:MAG: cytochrome P450 [Microthrixaceae bacterium]|nr:cytochrome P450 [Microthrixaceae bacterium]
MKLSDVDIIDPDNFLSGAHHEMFALLRAEDPVHWTTEPDGAGFWSVTKLRDLQEVNRDVETYSSELGGTQRFNIVDVDPDFDTRGKMLIDSDPPKHTRYRRIVNRGFTPRMIGLLETHLQYRAELIVDRVIEDGACDFVTDLAAELPLQAIAEMMGVPQEDRHLIFEWTNTMIGGNDPEYTGEAGSSTQAREAAMQLYIYSNQLAAKRREDPRDDLVTKLLNADIDGEALSEEEFDMFMMLLSVAGSETTRTATSHGMQALFDHPDQMRLMLDNLDDDDFIATAIEEIVRWATPVHHFRRTAAVDTELRGKKIAAGDKVLIWHVSANRDEEVFDEPFRFDLQRTPNEHVAFGGGGAHFCLGANLARAELRIILREMLSRLEDIRPAGPPERLRSNFIHGMKHMPVEFTPGSRKHPAGVGV